MHLRTLHQHLRLSQVALAATFLVISCGASVARDVTVAWNPNPESNIVGYTLRYGLSSGVYPYSVEVGIDPIVTLPTLPGGTYYCIVTAHNSAGLESLPSNELSFEVPPNDPPVAGMFDGVEHNSAVLVALSATEFVNGIVRLQFHAGGTLIGEVESVSEIVYWAPTESGNQQLTVIGFDAGGAETTWVITVRVIDPSVEDLQWATDGAFQFTVIGAKDRMQHVEWSENLNIWYPLVSEINTTGAMIVSDPAAAQTTHRFYRVLAE